ncbi:hypothetical protein [Magnetospirillum sp. SS-4]|uniref:hypothetical protein n=1 Tax=Magnetospirillum sp. SS-4 TaxID=2681465 RepID=UPI00137CE4EA|nr:hypothetical protein [Magnetospirillum sp. SS-4]CAA7614225.1 hypothetical protein MTBSS4_110029 [Magnetospirillum sp. SS-4]
MPTQNRYYFLTEFNSISSAIDSINSDLQPFAWCQTYYKTLEIPRLGFSSVVMGFVSESEAFAYKISLNNAALQKIILNKGSPCTFTQLKPLINAYLTAKQDAIALDRTINAINNLSRTSKRYVSIPVCSNTIKLMPQDHASIVNSMALSLAHLRSIERSAHANLTA